MRTTRLATTLLAAAALAGLAACQKAETPEQAMSRMTAETDAARPAIEAALAAYGRNYSAGHTDSLVAVHSPDAWIMPPNAPTVHGAEAIRQFFTAGLVQGGGQLALRSEHLAVNGPVAIERGRYNFTPPAGAPMPVDSGKYLTHWHQSSGTWLIAEVIWNSDLPAAPPPPPARRR